MCIIIVFIPFHLSTSILNNIPLYFERIKIQTFTNRKIQAFTSGEIINYKFIKKKITQISY